MAELTLTPKEVETLRVNIGDESYQLPLGGSMSRKEIAELDTSEGTYAYLCKHIPAEVLDNLPLSSYNQLIATWIQETKKTSGMTLGESKASRKR